MFLSTKYRGLRNQESDKATKNEILMFLIWYNFVAHGAKALCQFKIDSMFSSSHPNID